MSIIHLCDSEKGGAGKSLWCRVLCQYFIDNRREFTLVECDRSNADVMPHVIRDEGSINLVYAVFSENKRMYAEGDKLFNAATDGDVIANLPAQVRIPFNNWLEQGGILNIAEDVGVKFFKWFLVTGGIDSIDLFKDSFKKWGSRIPHVLVRNLYMAKPEEWEGILSEDSELKEICNQVLICDLSEFAYHERNQIDRNRLRFDEALFSDEVAVISRSRIQRFLDNCYQGIDEVLMISEDSDDESSSSLSSNNEEGEGEGEAEPESKSESKSESKPDQEEEEEIPAAS